MEKYGYSTFKSSKDDTQIQSYSGSMNELIYVTLMKEHYVLQFEVEFYNLYKIISPQRTNIF